MLDHHFIIGKQIIDEAVRLIRSSLPTDKEIRISKCTISTGIQQLMNQLYHKQPLGVVRLVFMVDEEPIIVLVNADYMIKKHHLKNV